MKYVKVMFNDRSGADSSFKYKINEVNIATNWNTKADNPRDFGGFKFSTPEKIIRWIHRGDTIYDVIIPKDAEVVDVIESATPHGVFRSNKIILTNPRKVNDDIAIELYKKTTIPDDAFPKTLAAVSVMGYEKTAKQIIKDKINKDNIDIFLEEWNDFMYHNGKNDRINANKLVGEINNILLKIKKSIDN